jgi:glycosidase
MSDVRYPSLYQINTRVWLTEVSRQLGRAATLDDIPDAELDRLTDLGFDWLWLLSVWTTSAASREVSRTNPDWRREFEETLPDLAEADIGGSGFAIEAYRVSPALGGNAALSRLRKRMSQRGLRLMLDFVPNHMGLAHPWLKQHPDYFVHGTEQDLLHAPQNYCRVSQLAGGSGSRQTSGKATEPRNSGEFRYEDHAGELILAYGRDPYFPGWPDALQLNYGNPALQRAMIGELQNIAKLCDGVRCDMAMLLLPDVFQRTWGIPIQEFWPQAIFAVKQKHERFKLLAEVYWDREWDLQQQGFDWTYDKRLYDRLHAGQARPVREHLYAGVDFQSHLARFLENHDEPRAAVIFSPEIHRAAAVITYLTPGMRFFHQGQLSGRRKKISPHLIRRPAEPVDAEIAAFYQRLLEILRTGPYRDTPANVPQWILLECAPAWEGNPTVDNFLAWTWSTQAGLSELIAVNFGPTQAQCRIKLPVAANENANVTFHDQLSDARYEHPTVELADKGLYVDLPAWGCHVFRLGTGT